MDRFRSGGAGSTATVEAQFRAEIEATQDALRASSANGRKQQRAARRQEHQHQKYVKEHKVAGWDVRKSGNPWMSHDMRCRTFKQEIGLGAVEGKYREPIRTVHGCVTNEDQLIHPDYKRVLPTPAGQNGWSNKDYGNPLKHPSEGRFETFSGAAGPGDLRVTTDLSEVYPRDFLATQPAKLDALERRAQSVESGRRGKQRAEFIARTRFFVAPDAYSIKDGYVSQRYPQAHPPTAPWRTELEETLRPQPTWTRANAYPRVLSGTGQSILSSSPYYNWREGDAAAGPRRALTDRARHSLYTADKAQESLADSKGLARTERLALTAKNTFRLSSRALTLSLPTEEVPSQFKLSHRARACVKDNTADPKKFIHDMLVDPYRDDKELKFVGTRVSGVIGRQSLPSRKAVELLTRPSTSPSPSRHLVA